MSQARQARQAVVVLHWASACRVNYWRGWHAVGMSSSGAKLSCQLSQSAMSPINKRQNNDEHDVRLGKKSNGLAIGFGRNCRRFSSGKGERRNDKRNIRASLKFSCQPAEREAQPDCRSHHPNDQPGKIPSSLPSIFVGRFTGLKDADGTIKPDSLQP
ncbi:hypothetical protein GGR57DRAFT_158736 [Xylariaceae sp. FL1272]|nr:hypothetical protein GGR57DRAFT_158736 [Xylariaceae sp. FL1272]